jgi:hypothetical protein
MAATFVGFWLGSPLVPEKRAVAGTGASWKCAARESVLAAAVGVNVPAYSILKFFQVDNAGMLRMTSSARYFKEVVGPSRPN